jgi:hypothetical protein
LAMFFLFPLVRLNRLRLKSAADFDDVVDESPLKTLYIAQRSSA